MFTWVQHNMPLVSVLLPTYNCEKYIANAIDSVLAQEYKEFELFVMIDGSTDSTEDIVKKYHDKDHRVVLIMNDQNMGLQKTLNKGLVLANGIYIARIDEDDVWVDPQKLGKQVAYFNCNPNCVLVGSQYQIVNDQGISCGISKTPVNDQAIRKILLSYNPFCHSSVMFVKEKIRNIGGYDEQLGYAEDWDLWLRLGNVGTLAILDEVMVKYLSRSGMSYRNKKKDQVKYHLRILSKYICRYPGRIPAVMELTKYLLFGKI